MRDFKSSVSSRTAATKASRSLPSMLQSARFRLLTSLLILVVAGYSFNARGYNWIAPAMANKRMPMKAIQVHQKHYFFGEMELTVSRTAVKIVCLGQMRFTVVSRAPSWTVTIYRMDDKTRFDESLSTFVDTSLVSGIILSYRDTYTMQDRVPKPVEFHGFKAAKLLNSVDEFVYIPKDKAIPEPVYEIIHAAYKLPTCGGIPIRYVISSRGRDIITQLDETGQHPIFLQTSKISQIGLTPDFFDIPGGLKQARSVQDVVISAAKRNETTGMDLMFDIPRMPGNAGGAGGAGGAGSSSKTVNSGSAGSARSTAGAGSSNKTVNAVDAVNAGSAGSAGSTGGAGSSSRPVKSRSTGRTGGAKGTGTISKTGENGASAK